MVRAAAPAGSRFHCISGPRQIGKTTWLKSILLKELTAGRSCFFYDCKHLNEVNGSGALLAVLKSLSDTDVILLDNLGDLRGWDGAVREFFRSGFEGSIVASEVPPTSADRLNTQISPTLHPLLPMGFDEWVAARREAGWTAASDRVEELIRYFRVGGFPAAVVEAGSECVDPVQARRAIHRGVLDQAIRRGRREPQLRTLMARLAIQTGVPISLRGLAASTGTMTYHTVQEYIATLEQLGVVRALPCRHPSRGQLRDKKGKKYYYTDPSFYWAALEWAGQPTPAHWQAQLAESVAHESLARDVGAGEKELGFSAGLLGEVDFVLSKEWACEVQWAAEPRSPSSAFLSLGVPSKTLWSQTNYLSTHNPS